MSETKRALSTGQVESAEECAGAHNEGERNSNPSKIVYHENRRSSIPYEEYFPKYLGMGIKEKTCAWCGKNFCPTPQWVYGDCCRYTCALRYDEMKQEELSNAREVVLLNPDTLEDVTKFKSAKEAAEFANVNAKDIRNACNGLSQKSGGYSWRWADEEPLRVKDLIPIYESEPKTKMSVAICRSAHQRLEKIADERGISKNKVAREILEKALLKEYEL